MRTNRTASIATAALLLLGAAGCNNDDEMDEAEPMEAEEMDDDMDDDM